MAISKARKQEVLEKLDEVRDTSASVVFVHYTGLTGHNVTAMRQDLRDQGVGYMVVKKTLLARSFGDAFEGEMPPLDGEIAIAYSDDAIAPAQKIHGYTTEFKDNLSIVGGVFEGAYQDQASMQEIATIPSMHTLRGMFVNVINAPVQGLAVSLSQIAEKRSS